MHRILFARILLFQMRGALLNVLFPSIVLFLQTLCEREIFPACKRTRAWLREREQEANCPLSMRPVLQREHESR